jgi:hypothetical protein
VNPLTGEVRNGSDVGTTASPTYWEVTYTTSVVSTSSASSTPSITSDIATSVIASSIAISVLSSTPTNASNPSSGLSSGAGAGIGVGSAAVVVGLVALAWWLVRRRRRTAVISADLVQYNSAAIYQYHDPGKADTPIVPSSRHVQQQMSAQELDQGIPRHEML